MKNFKTRYIYLSFICLLAMGCASEEKGSTKLTFKHSIDLVGEEILKDAIGLSAIHTIDNYLITRKSGSEYFFTVYSLDSLKELGQIVRNGDGPNEFPTVAAFDYVSSKNNFSYLWAHDLNRPILSKININKSLEEGKTVVEDTASLPLEESFVTVFKFSNEKIVGRSGNTVPDMGRLKIYNPKEKKISKMVPFFPKVEYSRTDDEFMVTKLNSIYVASLTFKPDGSRMASAMNNFNQVDIFDSNAELILSLKDNVEEYDKRRKEFLNNENLDFRHLKSYYSGVTSTNNFIFSIFRNQPNEDYGEKLIPVTVRVFDWEGNPIAELNIPDYLFSIAIDEKNGYLIGFSYHQEKLMRYDIKEVLDGKL